MRLQLRPYQVEALERVEAARERGVDRQLGVAATGLGKTVMFCALAEQMGGRTLILAHRDELVSQAAAKVAEVWPDVEVGIVKAERNEVGCQVVVASVQTLARDRRLRQLLAPFSDEQRLLARTEPFGLVVVDECFPAGTMVGGTPIEELRAGDLVPSWDEETGEPCFRRVNAVMVRDADVLVRLRFTDGSTLSCTPNHPLMTRDGWCPAGALPNGAELLSFTHHDNADQDDVRRVRETRDDHHESQTGPVRALGARLLRRLLQGRMGEPEQQRQDGCHQPAPRLGADEGQQSDGAARVGREDEGDTQSDRPQASGAWWKRCWPHRAAGTVGRSARVADGGRRKDRGASVSGRYARPLQARRRQRGGKGGGGDRRPIPFRAGAPRVRPAEGRVPEWRRVAGAAVLQLGGARGPEGRGGSRAVYNLEVDGTHTYLVGDGIVAHNCHHAYAATYRRILAAVGCDPVDHPVEWDRPLLLGVTATPDRGDGKGLEDIFDEITFSYDILWGIRAGFLADVRGLAVKLAGFDEGDLKVSKGDYEQGQAGRMLADAGAPQAIVRAWHEHAEGRRTIVFTPTVATAQQVADEFTAAGVEAAMVHGGTDLEERRLLLKKFSRGEITVMCNCAVLTEGYDNPGVDCIVVARPTKSRALYTQMVGRGTRLHPDKDHLLVLDVVGATDEHSLVTIPSLFGLDKGYRERAEQARENVSRLIDEQEQELVKLGRLKATEAAMFAQVRETGIAWVRAYRDGEPRRYVRSLGLGKDKKPLPTVVVANSRMLGDDPEMFVAGLLFADGSKRVLLDGVGLEMALSVGEDYVRKHSGRSALHEANAPWRAKKPTKNATAFAAKWHVKVDPKWNAGQLSDAIDAAIAEAKLRKADKKEVPV